jgi:hypothetical protein
MIPAPTARDAFVLIVDLQSYPANVVCFAAAFDLLIIRRRRSRLSLERTEFRVGDAAIAFWLVVSVFVLVMSWYPAPGGRDGEMFRSGMLLIVSLHSECKSSFSFKFLLYPFLSLAPIFPLPERI